jgi:hypothetical protein
MFQYVPGWTLRNERSGNFLYRYYIVGIGYERKARILKAEGELHKTLVNYKVFKKIMKYLPMRIIQARYGKEIFRKRSF